MRVEDVGSLSPTGDMLAFLLAIVMTISVISSFSIGSDHHTEQNDPVSVYHHLLSWNLLDKDDDGLMEIPGLEDMNGSYNPSLTDNVIRVILQTENLTIEFQVIHGHLNSNVNNSSNGSIIHTWIIPFELNNSVVPGRISIIFLEDNS